ncbi:MAG: ATP-binding protein [Hormoscilla sp.]
MSAAKIMIVEDELLIAKGLSRKLKKLDYTVVDIVSSGEAALESAAVNQPDLILMDIAIKGDWDGIETAAKIHESYDIPVIYVTAYADDRTLERAEDTGSYGYILKPYKERELHATIKIALSKHKKDAVMRQSLAAAEAVSEEKARYLSIASHDLRSPLVAIQMSAEMLKKSGHKWPEERKQKHLHRIQASVNNMNNLLEEVLTLCRAESGKLIFDPVPMDAIGFCRDLLEQFQPPEGDGHILTFTHKSECPPQIYLDEQLLRHILANLLSNAIKYSPQGGNVSLDIECEKEHISFQIQDEGIGMPAEYQTKLFQRFERAGNVGSIKGTGLGLSIVKQAVELHGGEITVESEEGRGTKFTVTLPSTK